ncbi:ATP-binding protein [uncultured Cocleimonas sp.]|uniref:ATP-binding protein n=1 Tax=uncultured Cocleimonas sp. TaxID=1051587 RepID=UPI00262455A3|nr:DUF87 domain-containing protein [uncultured Cocleimonas sp.]
MVETYEKLGLFYLGQDIDKTTQEATEALTLLKNKNFTTHATIIGMTGSGKTGLGVGIIEEAAIDNIPSIVIDPKGDMGNLCLTDPEFSPSSFAPWVADEAKNKEQDVNEYAEKISKMWKEGIESHHQDSKRVAKFTDVKKTIYTPGSSSGISVNVLSSLETPPSEVIDDTDSFSSYINSTVSSLLSLIGIEADPVESKEYILLAQLISHSWMDGNDLSLEDLVGRIISPPFKKIGVLPLDAFYPQSERFKFATKFNSIIASPTFKSWLEGETLDIQKLLYDENGKAKIAIFSISHLSDEERMFFVTLLLNKFVAWMRRQSGTSALKTLLYMDEIYGFFPPTKNPPSKEPMLILLKQARAYGVGVVLSTQNPVDLDYKGLSNMGTWFIGRLQTTQDIDRVIDGLGGKVGSSFNKDEIRALLANLKKRTFFLKSAHLDDIRLFSTRWVLSYLKGPLKRDEISSLMHDQKAFSEKKQEQQEEKVSVPIIPEGFDSYTTLDNSIPQYYMPDLTGSKQYIPSLMADCTLNFFNQSKGIDEEENYCLTLELSENDSSADWDHAMSEEGVENCFAKLPSKAPQEAHYAVVPDFISKDKQLRKATKSLSDWLYYEHVLELYQCDSPKLLSKPYESLGDFKVRVADILNDEKEQAIEVLQERYAKKEKVLTDRLDRYAMSLEKEESDTTSSFLNVGITVLGALFGKSKASIGRAGSRVLKERGDVGRAKEKVANVEEDLRDLEEELEDKIDDLAEEYSIDEVEIEDYSIKPRKTDVQINEIAVVWRSV